MNRSTRLIVGGVVLAAVSLIPFVAVHLSVAVVTGYVLAVVGWSLAVP